MKPFRNRHRTMVVGEVAKGPSHTVVVIMKRDPETGRMVMDELTAIPKDPKFRTVDCPKRD